LVKKIWRGKETEKILLEITGLIFSAMPKQGEILDIDATIIEAEKGDSKKTYKGIYGYQPVPGIISENAMVVGSEFREANQSPQNGLLEFIKRCRNNYPQEIKTISLPEEYHTKTVKALRYQLLKLAGKVVFHTRYMIIQISAPLKNVQLFQSAYYRLRYAPLPV